MKVLLALLFLCSVAVSQAVFNFPEPENFPGERAFFPQNAGGGVHFPPNGDPDAPFFENQTELPERNAAVWNSANAGNYDVTNFGVGVTGARGIVAGVNFATTGSSGRGVTGQSGRGAASGNGFGIAETKLPGRINVHTSDFVTASLNSSGASSVYPTIFVVFAVVALMF